MVRQIRPAQVYKTVTKELNQQLITPHGFVEPPWYKVVGRIPPSETIVRTIPPRHHQPKKTKSHKPKNLYRPQQITYPEDSLRQTFYRDHPWELARPRVILELDGKDAQRCDWSKGLQQPGIALSGECVVQRQLWLMETQQMPERQAYDVTRREFYRLRQQEEVEKRVALEEARYVGAYFGKNRLEIGMHLEDLEFEKWKVWAAKEVADREARAKAGVETFDIEEDADGEEAIELDDVAAGTEETVKRAASRF